MPCRLGFFLREVVDEILQGKRCYDTDIPKPGNRRTIHPKCTMIHSYGHSRGHWRVLEALLAFHKQIGTIWHIDCQRQWCRAIMRRQQLSDDRDHDADADSPDLSPPGPPPRKRARTTTSTTTTGDAASQLLEFFRSYPGLKKQMGGWIVRFYDPCALSGGPITPLIQTVREQIVASVVTIEKQERSKESPSMVCCAG